MPAAKVSEKMVCELVVSSGEHRPHDSDVKGNQMISFEWMFAVEWKVRITYLYHKEVLSNQMGMHMYWAQCRLVQNCILVCMWLEEEEEK